MERISGQRLGQLRGRHAQEVIDYLFGQGLAAEESGQRGEEDEEREKREQRAEGDVAGQRNRLVGEQPPQGVQEQRQRQAAVPDRLNLESDSCARWRCSGLMWLLITRMAVKTTAISSVKPSPAMKSGTTSTGRMK